MPNWSDDGFQRILAAGNKGGISTKKKFEKIREEYYKNPKLCLHCNAVISYDKRLKNKYCSRSCAKKNGTPKINKVSLCVVCNNKINKGSLKYCSLECQKTNHFNQRLEEWINGNYVPTTRKFFTRYLIETKGYKCSCCGINEWNNRPIVLEIDHIDGNSENNNPINLRFICPNCHSQTDTYKGKNKGKGRHYRRARYSEGKSY